MYSCQLSSCYSHWILNDELAFAKLCQEDASLCYKHIDVRASPNLGGSGVIRFHSLRSRGKKSNVARRGERCPVGCHLERFLGPGKFQLISDTKHFQPLPPPWLHYCLEV